MTRIKRGSVARGRFVRRSRLQGAAGPRLGPSGLPARWRAGRFPRSFADRVHGCLLERAPGRLPPDGGREAVPFPAIRCQAPPSGRARIPGGPGGTDVFPQAGKGTGRRSRHRRACEGKDLASPGRVQREPVCEAVCGGADSPCRELGGHGPVQPATVGCPRAWRYVRSPSRLSVPASAAGNECYAFLEQMGALGLEISFPAAAVIDRSFLYRHHDLLELLGSGH
jgi:hypothetical protein